MIKHCRLNQSLSCSIKSNDNHANFQPALSFGGSLVDHTLQQLQHLEHPEEEVEAWDGGRLVDNGLKLEFNSWICDVKKQG